MKDNKGVLGTALTWVCTIAQTNEVFQMGMLILSIISTIFSLAYTVYKWYNKAKQDGKITKQEMKDLYDDLADDFSVLSDKKEDKK